MALLRRQVKRVEQKLVALEKRLSVPVDFDRRPDPTAYAMHGALMCGSVITPDGLVMVRDVPHLVECVLVRQPLFGDRMCTCGSLGAREQKRS